ncbi:MAG: trypsin-like peptidase domain-containing protein [Spirochaetales bacterium]|nr:trypsin-like peptidase domain-containing protein [Spirochaetales bacterium]
MKKKAELKLGEDFSAPTETFSFRVSNNTYAVKLSILGSAADLDLFVYRAVKDSDYTNADYVSETDLYNDSIFITRQSDTPLESGIYYVTVAYQYDYLPQIAGKRADSIKYSILMNEISAKPSVNLKPDMVQEMKLEPSKGMFVTAEVNIPRGTDSFRVDVFNTNADIDIFASLKSPAKSKKEAIYTADSLLRSESLVAGGYNGNKLIPGKYYLSFVDQVAEDLEQPFSVVVTLNSSAPEALLEIPQIPVTTDGFDTAILSTVEVISDNAKGSGCFVNDEGYLITDWHVIAGQDGRPADDVYIAVPLTLNMPPSEIFHASVIEYDKDLDLALLKIDKGRYGQDIPEGYWFPHFEIGDPSELKMGQPVGILGYPEEGGTGSGVTISFTTGIVCGFEAGKGSDKIKTDALINNGNSGGAVMNAYYELLGFPGYTIDAGNGKMGYIYSVSNIPTEWLAKIEKTEE